MSANSLEVVTADEFRPSHLHLSNAEVRSCGIVAGGAYDNISRELLELRHKVYGAALAPHLPVDGLPELDVTDEDRIAALERCASMTTDSYPQQSIDHERNMWTVRFCRERQLREYMAEVARLREPEAIKSLEEES